MTSEGTEHRKLAAIMFTDMVGYSELAQRNEALALELLEEHHRLLRPCFPKFGGREIKSTGDGFLLEFASALAAVRCAIDIQRTLVDHNSATASERRIQIRIGVHLGDVVLRDGDIFGDGVNLAARIEPLAEAGGICLSRPVFDQVANKLDVPLLKLDRPELKNIQVPMDVYRMVLPWQKAAVTPTPFWPMPRLFNRLRWMVSMALVVLATAGTFWFLKNKPSLTPGRIDSLAVLPFENSSGETNMDYYAEGLTDEINAQFERLIGLKKVIRRTALIHYKGTQKSLPQIGRELGVDAVVEGSVSSSGARVRIQARLIDTASGNRLWSNSYERDLTGIVNLQNEMVLAMAEASHVSLSADDRARLTQSRPVNEQSNREYLLGKFYANKMNDADNLKAIEKLEHAVTLDKTFAAAHASLAAAYIKRFFTYAPTEYEKLEPLATLAIQQSLDLNPNLPEPYVARATLLWSPRKNFRHEDAVLDLQHALKLNPKSPEAHYQLLVIYAHTGFWEAAQQSMKAAVTSDSLSIAPVIDGAAIYLWKGDYETAYALWSKVPRGTDLAFVGSQTAWTLFALQKTDEAAATLESFLHDFPGDDGGELAAMKAVLRAAAGDFTGAVNHIEMAKAKQGGFGEFHHTAYSIASAYALMNQPTEALIWLKKAATTGYPCYGLFANDPNLATLRQGNSEFDQFLLEQKNAWTKRKNEWFKPNQPGVERQNR